MKFDLIVIGAGPGGYEVAAHQAAKGLKVAVIEKDLEGGTCLNRGCIPTKCLCAAADTLNTVINDAPLFGITIPEVEVNYTVAVERAAGVVAELRQGVAQALAKCTVFRGEASFTPDCLIRIGDDTISGSQIIIATGSRPSTLPVPGANVAITSDDFLQLEKLPESMVVIGGGVIGLEFAYIANSFGTEVTVIEYCKEILPFFDAEIAKRLRMALTQKGIRFLTSSSVTGLTTDGKSVTIGYTDKKGEKAELTAELALMAVGRKPVVPEGLEAAGIETDARGFIVTDNNMQTSRKGIYAVGDCRAGSPMLAHVATAQSMVAIGEKLNTDTIPAAVFTNPEVAMVGFTTEQCKSMGLDYMAKKALYRANGKALASGHTDGLVKLLYDPLSRKILGCHILGAHASDLIQEATLAISAGLSVDLMCAETIHAHPSLAEIVASAL